MILMEEKNKKEGRKEIKNSGGETRIYTRSDSGGERGRRGKRRGTGEEEDT